MNPTVLLVDDGQLIRNALIRVVKIHGFEALEAENALQALEILRAKAVHVVLSDIDMPGMNGIAFAEALREQKHTVPLALMTGNLEQWRTALQRMQGAGTIQGFFRKPWEIPEVIAWLQSQVKKE